MRTLLALTIIMTITIAGCTADKEPHAPVTGSEPEPEVISQQITVGMPDLPIQVDPAVAVTGAELTMVNCLYDGLVRLDNSGTPLPSLAQEWESSVDLRQWTFYLRPDLVWSDGTPITAEDVRLSWLRLLHPDTGSPHAYHLYPVTGARQYAATGEHDQEVAITASELRLDISFDEPQSYFPEICALPPLFPVQVSRNNITGRTSGPFIISSYTPSTSALLIPNPRYWDLDSITLTRINLIQTDPDTMLELFLDNTIDITDSPRPDQQEQLPRDNRLTTRIDNATYYLLINTDHRHLSDPRVRRALSASIDRAYLTSTVTRGGERAALGLVPPGNIDHASGKDFRISVGSVIEDNNGEHARSLLAEAGYPGGRGLPELTITTNASQYHQEVLTNISRMWRRELGLRPSILLELDWNTYLTQRSQQNYMIARAGWGADYSDPMSFLSLFASDHPYNTTGFSDPDYDTLISQARIITGDRRLSRLQEAEALLLREMPVIPLFYYADTYLKQPHIGGLFRHPFGPSFCFKQTQVTDLITQTKP